MNYKDYFKNIYSDFYGVDSLPKIEVKPKSDNNSQDFMIELFTRIDKLYINEEDRSLLKKIIEYIRKYHEEIEKNYIPFRIIIESNNDDLINELTDIIYEASYFYNYIDNNKKITYSLYNLDKIENYIDYGFITFTGLAGEALFDLKLKNQFNYELKKYLNMNNKSIVLITGNKYDIDNFFLAHNDIKNEYFSFKLSSINPDKQDIYNNILDKVSLDDNLKVSLLDYLSKTYNDTLDYTKYESDLVSYLSFNQKLPDIKTTKTTEEIFSELNALVGLKDVKKIMYDLVDMIKLKEKAGSELKIKDINLHMVFLGNPGTGKTTIARMLAGILYDLGYIKENKLIEVSVKDLVAEYVGQTAPKTNAVIEKSMNGVLFIDEAYALASKEGNSYNDEAIATLIQAMENYRDKLVVIFAGYTKEMQAFLDSNSGINSRIGYTLEFADYTTDELLDIFKTFTDSAGFLLSDDILPALREIIDKYRDMKNFGNARFVRNIYEKTVIKHASNTKDKKQKKILKTLTKNDLSYDFLKLD